MAACTAAKRRAELKYEQKQKKQKKTSHKTKVNILI